MQIIEDICKHAAQGVAEEDALAKALVEQSNDFSEKGAKVYAQA